MVQNDVEIAVPSASCAPTVENGAAWMPGDDVRHGPAMRCGYGEEREREGGRRETEREERGREEGYAGTKTGRHRRQVRV